MRESEEIDREAWARLLAELLASAGMTPEQAGSPSGPVGSNWRTIRRWLSQDHGVSSKSVRDICRELGYPPLDGLVRVGFLTADEARMGRAPATPAPPMPGTLRQIADVLSDDKVPDGPKNQLRRALDAAFDIWREMYKLRAPRERAARDRLSQDNADR